MFASPSSEFRTLFFDYVVRPGLSTFTSSNLLFLRHTWPLLLDSQHNIHILPLQAVSLPCRKQCRTLQHILDLPAIQIHFSELVEVTLTEPTLFAIQEILPDTPPRNAVKIRVAQTHVDSALECLIDVAQAICCQKQQALVVLQYP